MTLDELFLTTLKDIYFAERQLHKSLPKMAKAAQDPALKEAFTSHRVETQEQIERLQAWGISNDSDVVLYDDGPGAYAARAWWLLAWLGPLAIACSAKG